MKRKILSAILLFVSVVSIAQQKVIVIKNTTPDQDMTPVVYDALKASNFKNVKLIFSKGIYHFYPEKAFGKYHAVTNHDNSYKYFAFPLLNSEGIEIDGSGSDFIFHGIITPFLVEKSSGVKLKNFSVDWDHPFYLQGRVIESDSKNKSMILKLNPMTPFELEGNRLSFSTQGQSHPFLGETMVFDPATNAVAYNAQNNLLNSKISKTVVAERIEDDEFLLKGKFNPADSGLVYVFKGTNGSNRYAPVCHLKDSRDIRLEDINIYHAGGMGVIGEKSEDIYLNRVNVMLREGTDRMVTTTADATHFCNCRGKLVIENCLFENMLDDATNVHGTYIRIHKIVNSNTVQAGVKHHQQFDYDFAAAGDVINFVHNETLLPLSEGTIKSVSVINNQLLEIEFEDTLPAELEVGDALDNITWYPELLFRNNVVRNNRARSILISTRNKTIIENNSFSSMMTSILFEGDLNYWYESGSVNDVIVRNNKFFDCVYGGGKGAVIWINPRMQETDPMNPYEKNILIENNTFQTFDNKILDAKSVENLVFRNNTIVESGTYPKLYPNDPTIELVDCLNSSISGNTYKGSVKGRIVIDSNSLNGLSIDKKQIGFGKFSTNTQK